MSLGVGARLGHYAVTAKLGQGGMGEVWRATDTQLNRDVALKILPEAFATDPDRLARFQREAEVLASLNHPGIAAIYGIEEQEGTRALVLELVEGPTLADRIAKGPIPVDEALPIAKQIAEALEAAHEAGVIHRDLKPANIKVREDGTVKVLDFGLAKALDPSPTADPSQSPTLTAAATQMGVIMGTAAYMSPEQARGETVDRRADIWAFGVVLYEMLTGRRPFEGRTVSDTLASVLARDPDLDALPTNIPHAVHRLLRRCFEKEPKKRLRDIAEGMLQLDDGLDAPPEEADTAPGTLQLQVWQRPVPAAVMVAVIAFVVAVGVWGLARPTPETPGRVAQFALPTPPEGPLRLGGIGSEVAISRDGTRVVYTSGVGPSRRLYLREIGDLEATLLRGSEGGASPVFSSDGQSVAFVDFNNGALKRVSVLGGPAVTIAETGSLRGMSWGTDDAIVFAGPSGLLRVPATGGEPEPLTTIGSDQNETDHRWPDALPNGKGVLFTAWSGSDELSRLAVVSLETGAVSYLLPGGSHPRYSSSGHIVYAVGGTLWAVGFDVEQLTLTSNNPTPVIEEAVTKSSGAGNFSIAANGSLVYVMGALGTSDTPRSLVWVDREGREEPLASPPRPYSTPSVSPDGSRVAVDVFSGDGGDIWIHDLVRGTERILTTDPAQDRGPLWSPDGERVVFASRRGGATALFQKHADTPGDAERLMLGESERTAVIQPTSWTPDGQTLLFWEAGGTAPLIGLLSMEGERARELLLNTGSIESTGAISPDGGLIAYESDETGQREVYVQRFPDLGGKVAISTDGGRQALWSPDGTELFYRGPRGMMAVPVTMEPFSAGDPEVLFETQYYFAISFRTYDLAPDGQRFLMVKEDTSSATAADDPDVSSPQIVLVQNWSEELKRLVPVDQ